MNQKLLMISGDRSLASGKRGAFYNTLEELSKHFERIDVITPRSTGNENILFGNVHLYPSPWSLWRQPWWILKKGTQIFREVKFDAITVHDYAPFYNGLGANWLAERTRVPFMLEIHHIPGYPKAGSFKELIYRYLSWRFLAADARRARVIRVVNQYQTKKFLSSAGIPESKLRYIPSMYIDLDVFKPAEAEKKYDLISVARLEANKGTLELIKAVELLKKSRPEIILAVVGDGSLKKSLEKYVHEHGLTENVKFLGWLGDSQALAGAYRSTKVFVNPSRNEGGPRVALEAMACGTPVVTTRVGLMLDIIRDHENGFFCGWSPEEIARTLSSVLADDKLRETRGHNGLETAAQFERKSAIANYASTINDLVKKRLLIITQKVDSHDDLLGFFPSWIKEFSKHCEKVEVIAFSAGEYDLPSNVQVHSLGKDKGDSKLKQGMRMLNLLGRYVPESDAVFAHMSPIFAIIAWPFTFYFGKKLILWYLHRSKTF
ncbi:MAG TPA: glycosyltransferase family 4 protein, partial [Candidatus Paceibacterota bacterium]|nr:glycosyltransferase family 4 protein [Candidatus Paceibacterota bacterium]